MQKLGQQIIVSEGGIKMKYICYTLVDDLSGIAIEPDVHAPHGRRHPDVEGLNVLEYCRTKGDNFIATVPDRFPTKG